MVKIGYLSLDTVVMLILYDKGPLTRKEVHDYLKPIEITDEEFKKAWRWGEDLGYIRPNDRVIESNKEVWNYRIVDDFGSIIAMARYIPKMWDDILGEGHMTTFIAKITVRYRDEDKLVDEIKKIPIVVDAEEMNNPADDE